MNYLAHFYLAREDDGLIAGNLIADYSPGKKYKAYPEDIQRGVELHRAIDTYTDEHPEVEKTKARLRGKYRKYAPVIVDVFYDYCLGSQWEKYSEKKLEDFTSDIYASLHRQVDIMPEAAKITLGYMSRHDWLYHYSTYYGIEKALGGLSRRAKFDSQMEYAVQDLIEHEQSIIREFNEFFQSLQDHVQHEILS